ncbi:hypothetical protein HN371_28915 [Candidatus Poribacteria bacterium]|jgi:hypothetical protein|nr:hypothetical protein [Candidatus Poribacteria bacterium]MBT5532260.1 hypothetical protein [Candidatus Poribacteria bacterium]MBT5709892.1 hypothetical protein [Candidatus Poribacteria bacterium]MBT7097760.1 hypothetical protein [Candidatus Poribacteria bacterium]MBT7806191.1 hypothetical protein [Candidatus Poribacteria bacterium]
MRTDERPRRRARLSARLEPVRTALAAAALSALTLSTFAQTPGITSSELLPTGPHHIGDSLRVRVRMTVPRGITPEVAVVSNPPDDVVWGTPKLSKSAESADSALDAWALVWPVQVFRVDPYELPPIEIGIGSDVLLTEPFPVETVSVRAGPDAALLRDVRPPVAVYRTIWAPAILGGAALLLLAGYALYRRRPRMASTPEPVAPRQPSALEWAEAEFARMEGVTVHDEEALRQYIDDTSDVVREYLLRRVGVAAPRLTTLETLIALRDAVTDGTRGALRETLDGADYVKFAKQIPAQSAGRDFLEHSRETCRACEREWAADARKGSTPRMSPTEQSA